MSALLNASPAFLMVGLFSPRSVVNGLVACEFPPSEDKGPEFLASPINSWHRILQYKDAMLLPSHCLRSHVTTPGNECKCMGGGQCSQEKSGSQWINLLSNVPSIGCALCLVFHTPGCVSWWNNDQLQNTISCLFVFYSILLHLPFFLILAGLGLSFTVMP